MLPTHFPPARFSTERRFARVPRTGVEVPAPSEAEGTPIPEGSQCSRVARQ